MKCVQVVPSTPEVFDYLTLTSNHAALTFTPTGLSTGMECPRVGDDQVPDSSTRWPIAGD